MTSENHLEKTNLIKKNKIQCQIAACDQKTSSEKAICCSITAVSLCFKLKRKYLEPQNGALSFFFPVLAKPKNRTFNLTSKIIK